MGHIGLAYINLTDKAFHGFGVGYAKTVETRPESSSPMHRDSAQITQIHPLLHLSIAMVPVSFVGLFLGHYQ